jgi:alpha-L-rhamnosidase
VQSNFTDTPTDCPTRERAGGTDDITVFGPTAAVLVGEQAFLRRYLRNVAIEQYTDGAVPICTSPASSRSPARWAGE